jgi:hypothetical protein
VDTMMCSRKDTKNTAMYRQDTKGNTAIKDGGKQNKSIEELEPLHVSYWRRFRRQF